MKRLLLFILVFFLSIGLFASNARVDTIMVKSNNACKSELREKPFETIALGIPMLISGVSLKHYDNNLSNSQTVFAHEHSAKVDDYLRFAPGVLMYGLKLAGVQSASSWKKMIVADAFSAALMVGSVELLKRTTDYRRPDGSDYRSFPSGHSAMAFMMATMLRKEYGCVSPLYSIGGYALATYTSMSRVVSNRHWTSDVLCGAGIGIISTEIGYYLSELIFKENGDSFIINEENKPFSLGLNFGMSLASCDYNLSEAATISIGNGTASGITASYSINKYLSLDGQVNYNLFPIKSESEYKSKMLQNINVLAGVSGNYSFSTGIGIGARLLGGYNNFLNVRVDNIQLGGTNNAMMKTGVFLNISPYNNIEMQLFADYNLTGSITKECSDKTNYFTVGTSAVFRF